MKVFCSECESDFDLVETPTEGEIVSCPFCGTEFTVNEFSKLNRLEFEGEDWGE